MNMVIQRMPKKDAAVTATRTETFEFGELLQFSAMERNIYIDIHSGLTFDCFDCIGMRRLQQEKQAHKIEQQSP